MLSYKRPFSRPLILLLIPLSLLLLAACTGAQGQNESWPGLTADGDIVYVAYGPEVLAFDTVAEAEVWSYPEEGNRALFFYAPPSVQNGRVIFGDYGAPGGFFNPSPTISIYALNSDGNGVSELWVDTESASDRIVAKPLQNGDVVYIGAADKEIFAFSADNGEEIWRFETENGIWAQPALSDSGTLFVSSLDRNLYALDAETGEVMWQTSLSGALSGRPVLVNDLVLVSNFDNKLHALDAESGDEVWSADAGDWIWSAPAVMDDRVFFGDRDGTVFAVNVETGEQLWTAQASGSILTSPVAVDGNVYVTSEADEDAERGAILALSVEDGSQLWETNTEAPIYTTPVIVNDDLVVVINSETELLVGFNLESGTKSWSFFPTEE